MARVYILTFHWAQNYGAVLQAYALCETIKEMGHEVRIINYLPIKVVLREFLSIILRIRIRRLTVVLLFSKFKKKYLPISKEIFWRNIKLPITGTQDGPENEYIFLCGSDQIWNSEITKGLDYNYLLDFVPPGGKKISYAASMGGVEFPDDSRGRVKKVLDDFTAISAREEFTQNQVEDLLGRKVALTLDPVFLPNNYENIIPNIMQSGTYIAVFCIQSHEKFERTLSFLKKRSGLPIISIGPIVPKISDRHISSLDPGEWLRVIKSAEHVVTNSFHGLAFSIIFKRQFFCLGLTGNVKSRNDRLSSLCSRLNLEDRLILDDADVESLGLDRNIDYLKVEALLDAERRVSLSYLENALR